MNRLIAIVDSLWVILQQLVAQVPPLVWSAVGSLVLVFVAYRLARRSTRQGPWWEAQVKAYTNVVEQFLTIADGIETRAVYDATSDSPDPALAEQALAWGEQAEEGMAEIQKQIRRGRFLLSPRAVRLLEAYVREVGNIGHPRGHHFDWEWMYLARQYHQDFYELARVDLGTDWLLWWAVRRGWRRLTSQRPPRDTNAIKDATE